MNNNPYSVLTVSQLTEYIGMVLDSDPLLANLTVKGEVSNLKYYSSGHLYFSLKDGDSIIKCVMFRSYVSKVTFTVKEGMKVKAGGYVKVYPQSGIYQLYTTSLFEDGLGKQKEELEALKRKLLAEGLFDESRKKALPEFPERIGIVTSANGAALHDMINVIGRRYRAAQIIFEPASVQGENAPLELTLAVNKFSGYNNVDVLIIGRGGGASEDLSAFNSEALVRAIAACPFPVISAVGHETDFTLCDFVSDRRAPTPSAAAELATPDSSELLAELESFRMKSLAYMMTKIRLLRERVDAYSSSGALSKPEYSLNFKREQLDGAVKLLQRAMSSVYTAKSNQFENYLRALNDANPLTQLSRGYALVTNEDGKPVKNVSSVSCQETVTVRLHDGTLTATVNEIRDINKE